MQMDGDFPFSPRGKVDEHRVADEATHALRERQVDDPMAPSQFGKKATDVSGLRQKRSEGPSAR